MRRHFEGIGLTVRDLLLYKDLKIGAKGCCCSSEVTVSSTVCSLRTFVTAPAVRPAVSPFSNFGCREKLRLIEAASISVSASKIYKVRSTSSLRLLFGREAMRKATRRSAIITSAIKRFQFRALHNNSQRYGHQKKRHGHNSHQKKRHGHCHQPQYGNELGVISSTMKTNTTIPKYGRYKKPTARLTVRHLQYISETRRL